LVVAAWVDDQVAHDFSGGGVDDGDVRFFDRGAESAETLATLGMRLRDSHDENRLDGATVAEVHRLMSTIGNICHEAPGRRRSSPMPCRRSGCSSR
jgi:hypothetical protein